MLGRIFRSAVAVAWAVGVSIFGTAIVVVGLLAYMVKNTARLPRALFHMLSSGAALLGTVAVSLWLQQTPELPADPKRQLLH